MVAAPVCANEKILLFLVTVLVSVFISFLTTTETSARSTLVQSVSTILICCIFCFFECLRLTISDLHFLEQNLNSLSLLIANWLPEYSNSFFLFFLQWLLRQSLPRRRRRRNHQHHHHHHHHHYLNEANRSSISVTMVREKDCTKSVCCFVQRHQTLVG